EVPRPVPARVRLACVQAVTAWREADPVRRVDRPGDRLADLGAIRLRVEQERPVGASLPADAVVGEPKAAIGVEDEIVRGDQRPSVDRLVEALDLAGLDVDPLDPAALVVR